MREDLQQLESSLLQGESKKNENSSFRRHRFSLKLLKVKGKLKV